MPRRISLCVTIALLSALALSSSARATVVIPKDFAALCAEADLVFVGTVTATAAEWSDPQHQAIRTRVTFGDLTWVRGSGAASVTLLFAGGTLDGLREAVDGVPSFAVGERRVVFAHNGDYVSPLVGFNQGLFQVVDTANGPVVLDADGRAVMAVTRAGLQRGAASASETALPLDAFLGRVRDQMEAQ